MIPACSDASQGALGPSDVPPFQTRTGFILETLVPRLFLTF